MNYPIFNVEIRYEHDVVLARQSARQVAEALGFERQDQVRLATSVSELARNAFQYATAGRVDFQLREGQPQWLLARITDRGHGIARLQSILNGEYVSQTGMGLGIIGARRLMDEFQIESGDLGTVVVLGKKLPPGIRFSRIQLDQIIQQIGEQTNRDPFAEIQRQNQELLSTMAELEKRQQELSQLNRELEDTNRGVVALYAELDQRADYLRRVSDSKSRFFSNMTHEFRTPLNSIISLSRMLADRVDGDLTPEQEKQVGFICSAAADLSDLVNDLLDLAKVEAGKATLHLEPVDLKGLFAALRGTLRPLVAQNASVNLTFEDPDNVPSFECDESKLSQILRNFISNSLKFTEQGEVRVRAEMDGLSHVLISVADTGIGIAPEHQARIFEEFEQVQGPQQRRTKGTGLGLSLAKSLTELLGGSIHLKSEPGLGSTFSVRLPVRFAPVIPLDLEQPTPLDFPPKRVLIVDDDEAARYVLKDLLQGKEFEIAEASSGEEAVRQALGMKPNLIFLDLGLPDLDGRLVLRQLKQNSETVHIPVIIHTSRDLAAEERAELASLTVGVLSKTQADPSTVRDRVRALLAACGAVD